MKKVILSLISTLLLLSPLSSFEWGGLTDSTTSLSYTTDSSVTQTNAAYLWASTPLNNDGSFYLKGEGMYKISFNSGHITQLADLDLLKFAGSVSAGNSKLNFSAGRFSLADVTGAIFSQNCDGLYIDYNLPSVNISAYAGYTGLLNSRIVYMLAKEGYHAPDADSPVYSLSNPYIPLTFSVTLPSLFANQTLTAQILNFLDLSADKYNRMYATAGLNGPLSSKVFYNFVTDFATSDFKSVSNYSKFSVSAFISSLYLTGAFEYASGNNGFLSEFRGFSSIPVCTTAFGYKESGSTMVPSLSAAINLPHNMMVSAKFKDIFACPSEKIENKGLSGELSYICNIFSDLQLTAGLSGYKCLDNSSSDLISASLKLALSF